MDPLVEKRRRYSLDLYHYTNDQWQAVRKAIEYVYLPFPSSGGWAVEPRSVPRERRAKDLGGARCSITRPAVATYSTIPNADSTGNHPVPDPQWTIRTRVPTPPTRPIRPPRTSSTRPLPPLSDPLSLSGDPTSATDWKDQSVFDMSDLPLSNRCAPPRPP